jgi:hypothetical protein
MVAYTGIQGQNILIVSSDPANPVEGQIWYNSTSNLLKGYANVVTNAWASGGNMNTARASLTGFGTQTASIAAGGTTFPAATGASESYNGTSWTNTPSLNTARSGLSSSHNSPQTSGLVFGSTTQTESWNGSSWTSVNSMNTPRNFLGGAGIQTAALAFGGSPTSSATELWDGTSWTSNPTGLNTARDSLGGTGLQTAALAIGSGPTLNSVESFNGSTWTSLNGLNTGRVDMGTAGTLTAALAFSGQAAPARTTATELWNGTSWTNNPNSMSTARNGLASAGTQTAALGAGGDIFPSSPRITAATEEWTGQAVQVRTITTS